nr:radical SAM protein [Rhizobium laguerreae]
MGATAVFVGEAELDIANAVNTAIGFAGSISSSPLNTPSVVSNLDTLPTPAYFQALRREYAAHNSPDGTFKLGHLYEASRGCPYQCSFCNTITHRREYRTKSPAIIQRDLGRLASTSGRRDYVYFIDESFAYRNEWFDSIIPILEELPFSYGAQGNLAFMNPKKLDSLQRAGFVSIEFGLESADREILKKVGKNNRLSQATDLINSAAALDLNPLLFINVGLPGETIETLKSTADFLATLSPKVRISVAMPTPYKGTALDAMGRRSGVIPADAPPEEGYLYTGRIGHDLPFSETRKNNFLAKYGPNNFLESRVVDSFGRDVLELFGAK